LLRFLIIVVESIKNEEVYMKLETTYVLSFQQHCHEPQMNPIIPQNFESQNVRVFWSFLLDDAYTSKH